jgi:16S rRNA (cytidine1402-2'-O)-methyltransferase
LEQIINLLNEGKNIALVSDSGTPGISDPGYKLINEAISNDIEIIPIPGPSAFLTALVASGLPMDKFLYLGFLPIKKGRQTLLKTLKQEKRTIIIYESPHRLIKTLNQLNEYLGDRKIVIARELTKIHEEFLRFDLKEAITHFSKNKAKGEFVLIIGNESIK